MTLLRTTSTAVILCVPLVMGACSPKDKGPSAEKSAPAQALSLKGPSDKVFARHFDVPKRKTSESEAKQALGELKLLKKSGKALNWDDSSGKNGNYVYKNLSTENKDGLLTIKRAELFGVHMEDDVATFDRADFSGIRIYDEQDDVTVTMDSLSVARPTPDMANAIMDSLKQAKDMDTLEIHEEDLNLGFGAIAVNGLKVVSDEANISTKTFIWGEDKETKLSDFKLADVDFRIQEKKDEDPVTGSLGEFSATGLKTGLFKDLPKGARNPGKLMGGFNPLSQTYDTIKMDKLDIDSRVVSVRSEGFAGKATEKSGVTTMRSVGQPFIIELKDPPKDPEARRVYDVVKSLDFDEIVLQTSQTVVMDSNKDTISVKDGKLSMENGFALDYNYSASGVKAMTDQLAEMDRTGQNTRRGKADLDAAMSDLKLQGLQIRLEDQSIVERGLKLAAEFRGASPLQVKKEVKVALALAPFAAGSDLERDMIAEAGKAFGDFLEDGGTLSIVLDPKTPISAYALTDLKRSDITMDDLGFSARVD